MTVRPGSLRVVLMDRYLLGRMLPRMGVVLLVTLLILLTERILRLLDLVTSKGAPLRLVLDMAVNLVPHYLGLAMPAAFAVAVLTLLAALSRDSEIDVLESAGWSLRRIGAPFVVTGVILAFISLPLFGFIQPYSRYAYRAVKHAAYTVGWTGWVEEGMLIDAGDGLTISIGDVDATGRAVSRVFVHQVDEAGRESVLTARRGVVVTDPGGDTVRLVLIDGRGLVDGQWLDFERLRLERSFSAERNPFRPRGLKERELTLGELLERMRSPGPEPPDPRFAAEFHARLVRSVALVGVALFAVPLGVARKRSPAWPRIAIALVILVAFNELLLTTQSLAELGHLDPALGVWGVGTLFMGGSLWLYLATPGQGARSPLRAPLRLVETLLELVAAPLRRLGRWLGIRA